MRILYITLENMNLQKGSVVHVKEVVNGLQRLGHHVGLVAYASNKNAEATYSYNLSIMPPAMLRLLRLKRQPYVASILFLFLYLWRILYQYDIIYARDFHTVITALLPSLIFKKKVVFEINGIANEEQKLKSRSILNRILVFFIRKAEKVATKYSEKIISVTPHIATYLVDLYNCPPDKVITIANGVNTKIFYPVHDEVLLRNWKKKVGISEEEIIIVFAGNLAPWQGVETLIEMAPLLLKETGNIRFLIIGDGKLRPSFETKVKSLGVEDHFLFTGMVDHLEVPLYLNIADICVLPKRRLKSGYSPIKLYEYMACGKPVVASRVEGLEFIEEEGTGSLTEPEDISSLEKALYNLIKDPQKRLRQGEKGCQIAREKFNWESRVIQIGEVLRKMA